MLSKMAQGLLLTVLCLALFAEAAPRGRKRPLLGGWRKMNKTSTEAQEAGKKATEHLAAVKNSAMAYRLYEIRSAKYQIVAGTNYWLNLTIAKTNCMRNMRLDLDSCQNVKIQKCSVIIYVPLQSNSSRMTNYTCGKEKSIGVSDRTTRVVIPGGEQSIDVSDEGVRSAATFATAELTTKSNGRYRVQHQRLIKATSQVVSGIMYRITMAVSVAFQNGQTKTTQCEVKVWDQAWMTPRYKLHQYNCDRHIAPA